LPSEIFFVVATTNRKEMTKSAKIKITEPEEIPARFAEAWNERDPDKIAALFDEDADFVNVVGIWWT